MFESVQRLGHFHGALPEGEDFFTGTPLPVLPLKHNSCDQQVGVHAVEVWDQYLTDMNYSITECALQIREFPYMFL